MPDFKKIALVLIALLFLAAKASASTASANVPSAPAVSALSQLTADAWKERLLVHDDPRHERDLYDFWNNSNGKKVSGSAFVSHIGRNGSYWVRLDINDRETEILLMKVRQFSSGLNYGDAVQVSGTFNGPLSSLSFPITLTNTTILRPMKSVAQISKEISFSAPPVMLDAGPPQDFAEPTKELFDRANAICTSQGCKSGACKLNRAVDAKMRGQRVRLFGRARCRGC